MQQFRVVAAWSAVYLALAIFLAHSAYGLYLDLKLGRFVSGQLPPKRDRWDRSRYPREAEDWLVRDERWHASRKWVWLGCILGVNIVYWILKP